MAVADVVIEPMTEQFVLWRCLHGGPLSISTIENVTPHPAMDWSATRARNIPLLRKLITAYGSCAILAYDGEQIIGQLRFYPKELPQAGAMCLQQAFPNGPADDLVEQPFPPLEALTDKTLLVHCLMTGSPSQKDNPYQRQGIGGQMVRELIRWARERGWQSIEAPTHEDLPLLYAVTGTAGRTFWEKLGFRVVRTEVESAFTNESDFTNTLRKQAVAKGLRPEAIKNRYIMRFDLALGG